MKATVSALALAVSLAACATTAAGDDSAVAAADDALASTQRAAADVAAAPTLEQARAFVARAEKELSEFAVVNSRAQWVNATYITDDTDALAAHFGTIGTEMSVRFARSREICAGAGAATTPAQLTMRGAPRPCPRRHAGSAAD